MRRGVTLFSIVLLAAAFAAAVARADAVTTLTDTTTDTTTTATTTTATTTTSTTTTSTTTTQTTTTQTTTTPTTTTTKKTTYAPLGRSGLPQGCVGAGVAAIATPGTPVGVLALPGSGLGASEYPASNPFIKLSSAWAGGSSCSTRHVTLRNVSLFGGAVTAATVTATDGTGTVTGLRLNGSSISLAPGQTIAVGSWGLLTRAARGGRLTAPLALRLVQTHGSVPAQTTIYIAFAARAAQHRVVPPVSHNHHHRHHSNAPAVPQPLAATPPLGLPATDYVFPIDGGASYIDTYGAGRSDIYDGWHHGDDLFAPLGTPVVAVADGKLSLVGWNAVGGWRLWLTDSKGNSFYYAHLAGYSRYILSHRKVKAGQVIAFLGRTGDAFPTPPHVHFEVHPHQFVQLGYDGAVNPTSYLNSWRVETLPQSQIPAAASLQAPAGTPSQEAAVVWAQLLKARHLMPDGQPLVALVSSVRRPFPAEPAAAQFVDARRLASSHRATTANPWPLVTLGLTLVALAAIGSLAVVRRRRSS